MEHLRCWAARQGLQPSEIAYLAATRDRRPLRFTAGGDQATERAWRTHWMRPDLPAAARERTVRRQSKPPDLVVIEPLNEWSCTSCGGSGSLLLMESEEHQDMLAWLGLDKATDFDPHRFDVDQTNRLLAATAASR